MIVKKNMEALFRIAVILLCTTLVSCATGKTIRDVEDVRDDGKKNVVALTYEVEVYVTKMDSSVDNKGRGWFWAVCIRAVWCKDNEDEVWAVLSRLYVSQSYRRANPGSRLCIFKETEERNLHNQIPRRVWQTQSAIAGSCCNQCYSRFRLLPGPSEDEIAQ